VSHQEHEPERIVRKPLGPKPKPAPILRTPLAPRETRAVPNLRKPRPHAVPVVDRWGNPLPPDPDTAA